LHYVYIFLTFLSTFIAAITVFKSSCIGCQKEK
jgi:hypothetical protein